jgi:TonB family protein
LNSTGKDYYKILQIAQEASPEVIESAFNILAQKYHPEAPEGDADKYNAVRQAYDILINPEKRKAYDLALQYLTNSDLPPVYPVKEKQGMTMQAFINLLYEQISFESVNHNPAKSRVYQEIYEEVVKKRNIIESTEPQNNPLWKILKAYQQYLTADEFNSMVLMGARLFKIPDNEAERIISRIEVTDVPYNKMFAIVIIVFIAAALGLGVALLYYNKTKISNDPGFFPVTQNVNDMNTVVADQGYEYHARIYDIGLAANIRSAPSTEWNNIVGKITPNERVQVIKHEPNGWYYIKIGDTEGYIYGGLLEDNDYPDAFPVVKVEEAEIKVFDNNHKVVKILKANDRFVVFYHDNENYYINSEKGNLISINKKDVTLDNRQNVFIPYIDDNSKKKVVFAAVTTEQVIVEDDTNTPENELINTVNEDNSEETDESVPQEMSGREESDEQVSPAEENPPIIYPGQNNNPQETINDYTGYVQQRVLNYWSVPTQMPSYSSVVIFRVARDGSLLNLQLANSSGNRTIDNASMKAVQLAAPFRPLPENFNKDFIDIRFNFDER